MPEGPEVQTIVNQLNQKVRNQQIKEFILHKEDTNILGQVAPTEFRKQVIDHTIVKVHRRSKYIDFELDSGAHIITHLLITGRLTLLPPANTTKTAPVAKQPKVIASQAIISEFPQHYPKYFKCAFKFKNGFELCLGDQRGWTKLLLLSAEDHKHFTAVKALGIDIFSAQFTPENFKKILNTPQSIYKVLMDQTKISGLGNIYVNETLFLSEIHPLHIANTIPQSKIEKLYQTIKEVTQKALREHGTTIESFLEKRPSSVGWHTLDGTPGNYQHFLYIFDKTNKPCPKCNTPIKKIKIGGRVAYFCPKHQL